MNFKAEGEVSQLLASQMGKTKSGKDWERRDYLLTINKGSQYEHSIKFSVASFDGLIVNPPQPGEHLKLGLRIIAHQFNGKWFNDLTATEITRDNKLPNNQ